MDCVYLDWLGLLVVQFYILSLRHKKWIILRLLLAEILFYFKSIDGKKNRGTRQRGAYGWVSRSSRIKKKVNKEAESRGGN